MSFFHYSQNNSGGSFIGDYHHVIVEAMNAEQANSLATSLSEVDIYFNGCASGRDCDCCGDRWSEAWLDEGEPVPMVYGTPVAQAEGGIFGGKTLVAYLDGRREEFGGEFK